MAGGWEKKEKSKLSASIAWWRTNAGVNLFYADAILIGE
jgi:hypothetical protein